MRFFSFVGDGDLYFYAIMAVWAQGKWNKDSNYLFEADYLGMSLMMGVTLCYILKSMFHKSRQYFDNLSLGDTVMKDCACEFGNPSGHSLNAVQFTMSIIFLYTHIYRDFFKKNRLLYAMTWVVGAIYVISVVYSRIYAGRHTLD